MIFDYSKFPYNNDNIIEIFSINNKLNIYLRDNIEEVLKDYSNPYLEPFKPKGGYEFTDKSNYNEGIKNDNLTINPNNWKNFSEKLRIIRFNDFVYLQSQ